MGAIAETNAVVLKASAEYTIVQGLPVKYHQVLHDELRYLHISANRFNPTFASGRWDGYIRLYDRINCRFPTGLLPKVAAILKREGLSYELESYFAEIPESIGEYIYDQKQPLRPYQLDAVDTCLRHKRCILQIPTGGGKTRIAEEIIHLTGSPRVLFLVPNRTLLNQIYQRFELIFKNRCSVLKWGDDTKASELPFSEYILVSTYQSASKNKHLLSDISMVFCDEAHRAACDHFKEALRYSPKCRYFIGLSATPFRDDGADMEMVAWIGPIRYQIGYEELIRQGYLVPPRFVKVKSLEEAIEVCKGKKTLYFSEKKKELEDGRDIFTRHRTSILTGSDSSRRISQCLTQLELGNISGIAATPIFDEGLDVPAIEAIVFYSTGKGAVRTYQRIGRGMRPHPGKTEVLVVDVVNKFYPYRHKTYMKEEAFRRRLS